MSKAINQGPGKGELEPRDLARGGSVNSTGMGNANSEAIKKMGDGRTVHRSGGQHGLSDPAPARSEGEIFPGFPGRR
jgi:hypothetical protein